MATTVGRYEDVLATRLYLDGQWNLDEFEVLFRSFNDLYTLVAAFSAGTESVAPFIHTLIPFHRKRLKRVAREQQLTPLRVLRFNYSSPGHIDLIGVGKVAEVTKDTLFGIADRIIASEDRESNRDRKILENAALESQTASNTIDANLRRAHDAELHGLTVAEKRLAIERAEVALTSERLDAAAKGFATFREMLDFAQANGASDEDISKMSAGFISKVAPIIPLILEGKLLSKPSAEERKPLTD